MRVPRRVPWASKAELAELYDLIFLPGASTQSREAAMSRMSIYISSPSCPAFLHLLHALITALLLPYPPPNPQASHTARLTYAMALVRFVNGMVDPLQTGLHARPISHLAAQLGIPPALVTLRHRATHEDLPPLPLLRRALEASVDYVHRNSFLPLLASSSSGATMGWDKRARAEALVAQWKKVTKARVRARDVTLESASGQAVRRLKRDVAAAAAEPAGAEELVDAVVRVGLVPVARKKRPGKRDAAPSDESRLVWVPLLHHVAEASAAAGAEVSVAALLAQAITAVITDTAPRFQAYGTGEDAAAEEDARRELASYRWALGVWLRWAWEGAAGAEELRVPEEERVGVLRRLARELVHEDDDVLRRIYGFLAQDGASLAAMDTLLDRGEAAPDGDDDSSGDESEAELEGLDMDDGVGAPSGANGAANGETTAPAADVDAVLAGMEANLRALEKRLASARPSAAAQEGGGGDGEVAVLGWTRAEEWRPCPIGTWV